MKSIEENLVIMGFSNTKRIIDGPFQVMGRKKVLRSLAYQILNATDRPFLEGWITLLPADVSMREMINNPPLSWDEAGYAPNDEEQRSQ